MGVLMAGWGQADITPRGGAVSLCGQFETRITTEVRDPMQAVALMLEKDGVEVNDGRVDLERFGIEVVNGEIIG